MLNLIQCQWGLSFERFHSTCLGSNLLPGRNKATLALDKLRRDLARSLIGLTYIHQAVRALLLLVNASVEKLTLQFSVAYSKEVKNLLFPVSFVA